MADATITTAWEDEHTGEVFAIFQKIGIQSSRRQMWLCLVERLRGLFKH
jgi:hypothetical protein